MPRRRARSRVLGRFRAGAACRRRRRPSPRPNRSLHRHGAQPAAADRGGNGGLGTAGGGRGRGGPRAGPPCRLRAGCSHRRPAARPPRTGGRGGGCVAPPADRRHQPPLVGGGGRGWHPASHARRPARGPGPAPYRGPPAACAIDFDRPTPTRAALPQASGGGGRMSSRLRRLQTPIYGRFGRRRVAGAHNRPAYGRA